MGGCGQGGDHQPADSPEPDPQPSGRPAQSPACRGREAGPAVLALQSGLPFTSANFLCVNGGEASCYSFYEDTLGLLPASREGMWATEGAPPPANPGAGAGPQPPDCPEEGLEGWLWGSRGPGAQGRPCPGTVAQRGSRGGGHPTKPSPASKAGRGGHRCWTLPEPPETQRGGVPGQGAPSFFPSGPKNSPGEIYEQLLQSLPCSSLTLLKPHSSAIAPPASTLSPPAPPGASPSGPKCLLPSRGVRRTVGRVPSHQPEPAGTPVGPGRLAG